MADCTVQQVYDYLRFGKPGYFVKFCCPKRTVTIQRVSGGIDTIPTCRITGDGRVYTEDRPSILEPLIERLLREEAERND